MIMKEMTTREVDRLSIIYQGDGLDNIRNYKVGDFYLMIELENEVESGDIISVYEVIKKKSPTNIESRIVMVKVK